MREVGTIWSEMASIFVFLPILSRCQGGKERERCIEEAEKPPAVYLNDPP